MGDIQRDKACWVRRSQEVNSRLEALELAQGHTRVLEVPNSVESSAVRIDLVQVAEPWVDLDRLEGEVNSLKSFNLLTIDLCF